jgi:hypothetical protein
MEKALGRSRFRTERRQSPESAETVFGAGKENLWLARAGLSTMSETPSASESNSVTRRCLSVQDRTTKEGKPFKSQSVKITNIAPLWGHAETEEETF